MQHTDKTNTTAARSAVSQTAPISRIGSSGTLVTIIIAVYNVMAFLPRCVDTVLGQTLPDDALEIIFVDDCSTDGSYEYLRERAVASPRANVHVLRTPQNSGNAALPRNTGFANAKGEYIYFLDGDDYIAPNLAEAAYGAAKRNDADIVLFRICIVENETIMHARRTTVDRTLKAGIFNADTAELYTAGEMACWNKLCKAAFLRENDISFAQVYAYDDWYFMLAVILAERIVSIPNRLVYYRKDVGVMARLDYTRGLKSCETNWRLVRARTDPRIVRHRVSLEFELLNGVICCAMNAFILEYPDCEAVYAYVRDTIYKDFAVADMAPPAEEGRAKFFALYQRLPTLTLAEFSKEFDKLRKPAA